VGLRQRIPVCEHGDENSVSDDLIFALARLERDLGLELAFTSGFRCPACNERAGGTPGSAHTRGLAVDISVCDSAHRFKLIDGALRINLKRIGIAKTYIHIDLDKNLPQSVLWLY